MALAKPSHHEWYSCVATLRATLQSSPGDIDLANKYWAAISGSLGYDVRSGKRLVDTFRKCALKSESGLGRLIQEFRHLAEDTGEFPHVSLFDPPLENALRNVARQPNHVFAHDAAWILTYIDSDE